MEKKKAYLIVVPVVMSLICIVFAVNAVRLGSQLNAERARATGLNTQIVNLGAQLAGYNDQAGIINDLQSSLDAARRDTDAARREVETLRAANSDLEVRLSAQQTPVAPAPVAPAPAAEQ